MKFINLKEEVLKLNNPYIISMLQAVEVNRGKTFNLPTKIKLNRLQVSRIKNNAKQIFY